MNIKTVEIETDSKAEFHYLDDYTEYEGISEARRDQKWVERVLGLLLRHKVLDYLSRVHPKNKKVHDP